MSEVDLRTKIFKLHEVIHVYNKPCPGGLRSFLEFEHVHHVEAVIHEICHAVTLPIELRPDLDLPHAITEKVRTISPRRADQDEYKAAACSIHVLRHPEIDLLVHEDLYIQDVVDAAQWLGPEQHPDYHAYWIDKYICTKTSKRRSGQVIDEINRLYQEAAVA